MRKEITILIMFFTITVLKAQESEVTTFHRMLVFNKDNKMLVVKFKNKNLWVTPGLYQNSKQTIKQGIDSIAKTYGIKVYDLELRGIYGLINPSKNYYSTRNIFLMKTETQRIHLPENIDKVLWLKIEDAILKITIPHINEFINDVYTNPNNIRMGTVKRYLEGDRLKSEISEVFYSVN